MKVIFATKNKGKLKEAREIFSKLGLTVEPLPEGVKSPEETGKTFLENAIQKATFYCKVLNEAVIAEDSGLEVDVLNGLPGVLSARFAGVNATDEENLKKLVSELLENGVEESPARYVCVAVFCTPSGMGMWAEGKVEGKVITNPRGTGGFGYDPIFVPEGYSQTMAELPLEEKNRISHRGRALRKLAELVLLWLQKRH